MKNGIVSTLVLALVATFGDWIWAGYLSRHLMIAGLIHGALLCLAMGAMIGWPARRVAAGAAGGIVVGLASAGLFYVLAPLIRYGAMLPAWFALWVLLALLYHWLAPGTPARLAIVRGIVAGLASGLAFYLVSGMWTNWNPASINYAEHFGRWAFAFAPGFLVVLGGSRTRPAVAPL